MTEADDKPKRDKYASSLAVERAADLLLLLASREDASVTELAGGIGASGGATHRILSALVRKGLVTQNDTSGHYSLAWNSLALARARGGGLDVRRLALPVMTALRDETGETVTLNIRHNDQLVCIEQVDSKSELRWVGEVGRVEVLYAGAAGKMLLAGMSPDEIDSYLGRTELKPLTPLTITDPARLADEIAKARRSGLATGEGERAEGIFGLASPIFDGAGAMVAAVSLGAPSSRMQGERVEACKQKLIDATRRISGELGYRWPSGAQVR